ncbi:MAG: tetratricopeptide repeat protein [Pseudomonadota bacterium]|nr:tetratricopeptide repeat protein [Pseudomonadota bacterium]
MAVTLIHLPPPAAAQDGACDIEEIQRMFGMTPRPLSKLRKSLHTCEATGATDYRVSLFLGVLAREDGEQDTAIAHLRRAMQMAPGETNPALELGVTLEAAHPDEARDVYTNLLTRDPALRPARLGLARVARRQNHLHEAETLYRQLLEQNRADIDARNGLSWLALARHRPRRARQGFEEVLRTEPGNAEARASLAMIGDVHHYTLEMGGIIASTPETTSHGMQLHGTAALGAFDTLELGWSHASADIATVSANGLTILPRDDVTLGYHRLVPLGYAISVVYDYRGHGALPTEHWIDGSVTIYLTDRVRWSGGYRKSFGDALYDGRLLRTGLGVDVAPRWQVTATLYNSQQAAFEDYRSLWSGALDITYAGPHELVLSAGVGVTPAIDNRDLHLSALVPISGHVALRLAASHNSYSSAQSLSAGLRMAW